MFQLQFYTQALDQCEKMLSDLGVVKIGARDTADAAQVYYEFSLSKSKHWLSCTVACPNNYVLENRQWPQIVQETQEPLQVPELQKYMGSTYLQKEFR